MNPWPNSTKERLRLGFDFCDNTVPNTKIAFLPTTQKLPNQSLLIVRECTVFKSLMYSVYPLRECLEYSLSLFPSFKCCKKYCDAIRRLAGARRYEEVIWNSDIVPNCKVNLLKMRQLHMLKKIYYNRILLKNENSTLLLLRLISAEFMLDFASLWAHNLKKWKVFKNVGNR